MLNKSIPPAVRLERTRRVGPCIDLLLVAIPPLDIWSSFPPTSPTDIDLVSLLCGDDCPRPTAYSRGAGHPDFQAPTHPPPGAGPVPVYGPTRVVLLRLSYPCLASSHHTA